jgi:hypothetical protein
METRSFRQCVLRFAVLCVIVASSLQAVPADEKSQGGKQDTNAARMPMPVDYDSGAESRWLRKPVLDSRLLDDMENPATWSHGGPGRMEFTTERCKDGKQSARLISPTVLDNVPDISHQRMYGQAFLKREFAGEDWRQYNRLSFWVYPTLPGFSTINVLVVLYNDGKQEDMPTRGPLHYVLLKPNQWNHVVWEIPHLTRDKVTAIEFHYRLQGNEPGAATTVCYDFDQLELQKVDADHYEGWNVAPGRIAFCHTGYRPGSPKTAIASDLPAANFQLIEAGSGKIVLDKPIPTVKTRLGNFQVMDFTEAREPGTYVLRAGDVKTWPFRIGDDIWEQSIWKAINFFYCERCGMEVPGVHKACHADWRMTHGDKTIIVNGGWHDAGDLSQGTCNTSLASYAMFSLAEKLRGDDPKLAQRIIEEARWGLDWILKTRFDDGFRVDFATMDRWTDGIPGTPDDMVADPQNKWHPLTPIVHTNVPYTTATTEALAARMLADSDPALAARCLKAARSDWQCAVETADAPTLDFAAAGTLAAMEMFKATGEKSYADRAVQLADVILACQQREAMPWDVPLSGFFYTDTKKDQILHYFHADQSQAPIVALAKLCEAFPDHPNWMRWYSAVVLYSEHLRTLAEFTSPYGMLPASIYRLDESTNGWCRGQIKEGIRLADGYCLRLFPVWDTTPQNGRGNNGIILSKAKALSTAARLRNDPTLADLCERQLQWVIGRNPFCQSLMCGEGHDYAPQYTVASGTMVGQMPVGIQTCLNRDVPYWPTSTCYVYKETWVFPPARWLWIMRDLADLAQTVGKAGMKRKPIDLSVSQESTTDGGVTIRAKVEGAGRVRLAIRASNLNVANREQEVQLAAGKPQTITWTAKTISAREPWVAVIVPNGDMSARKELVGVVK